MTNKELDAAFYRLRNGQHTSADIDAIENELNIYKKMALRLERCVHELVKEAEWVETPPAQVPGWRRMDKMPEQQPQATTNGASVDIAPCPDCGAFPYTAEAQFYSGLGAVAVCASCKKPYKPVILEAKPCL